MFGRLTTHYTRYRRLGGASNRFMQLPAFFAGNNSNNTNNTNNINNNNNNNNDDDNRGTPLD